MRSHHPAPSRAIAASARALLVTLGLGLVLGACAGSGPDLEISEATLGRLQQDPAAAAKYVAAHHDRVEHDLRALDSASDSQVRDVTALLGAATVRARSDLAPTYAERPGDNPAVRNTEWLMTHTGSGALPGPVRVGLAEIAAAYLDDYARTLGSPLDVGRVRDPGHDGVSVGTRDWQRFLARAAADEEGMAIIAVASSRTHDRIARSTTRAEYESPSDDASATFWQEYGARGLQVTVQALYGRVAPTRDDDPDEQLAKVDDWVTTGMRHVPRDGGSRSITARGARILLQEAVRTADDPPGLPLDADTKQRYVADALAQRTRSQQDPRPDEPLGFAAYDDGRRTWDGDTADYTEAPDSDFTAYLGEDSLDTRGLASRPAAWSAANRWLLDPAIQSEVAAS